MKEVWITYIKLKAAPWGLFEIGPIVMADSLIHAEMDFNSTPFSQTHDFKGAEPHSNFARVSSLKLLLSGYDKDAFVSWRLQVLAAASAQTISIPVDGIQHLESVLYLQSIGRGVRPAKKQPALPPEVHATVAFDADKAWAATVAASKGM